MAQSAARTVLRCLRTMAAKPDLSRLSDQELLQQFVAQRDESAFAEVVRRHGPMVLDAARCVLHNLHDAEDVFQAAFLVLVRKAGSIRKQSSLASWLYGVAYRLAMKARGNATKQKARQRLAIAPGRRLQSGKGVRLHVRTAGGERIVPASDILVAAGRTPAAISGNPHRAGDR